MDEPAAGYENRRLSPRRPAKVHVKAACRIGALDLGPNLALSALDVSETEAGLTINAVAEHFSVERLVQRFAELYEKGERGGVSPPV